jgi:hypothetical protein
MKLWMKYVLTVSLGALAGFAYWYWSGCERGCGITGQWWSSMAYGGVMGWLVTGLVPGNRERTSGTNDDEATGA